MTMHGAAAAADEVKVDAARDTLGYVMDHHDVDVIRSVTKLHQGYSSFPAHSLNSMPR